MQERIGVIYVSNRLRVLGFKIHEIDKPVMSSAFQIPPNRIIAAYVVCFSFDWIDHGLLST